MSASPTMADAMETARQIVKTSDDCLCEGVDMATLVSRIEAHVLAYAAERERLLRDADAVIAAVKARPTPPWICWRVRRKTKWHTRRPSRRWASFRAPYVAGGRKKLPTWTSA